MSHSLPFAVSCCPTRVPCCEGREGQWGYDHCDDHCHMWETTYSNKAGIHEWSLLKFEKAKKFSLSPAAFLHFCFIFILHKCPLPQMKVFQLNLKRSVTLSTFPGENIFARTHSVWPHAVTWDEVFDLRCLPIFLLLYVPLCTGYSDVTSVADLWSPRVPSRWPNAGPRRKLNTEESERHLAGQKANVMCSPLVSPAKRTGSTLGPLGFIYPFLFFPALAKSRPGIKSVRCHMTAVHTVLKSFMFAFPGFTLSGSISSVRHWSVMVKGDFFGRSQSASAAPFALECSLTRATEVERTSVHVEPENCLGWLKWEATLACVHLKELDKEWTLEIGRNCFFIEILNVMTNKSHYTQE